MPSGLPAGSPKGLRYTSSKMTREAIVRRVLLPMTVHAESHRVIDGALGDRLLPEIAVALRAVDLRADVRRVVELHVRFLREAIHTLPGNLDALLRIRRHLLDQGTIGRDL